MASVLNQTDGWTFVCGGGTVCRLRWRRRWRHKYVIIISSSSTSSKKKCWEGWRTPMIMMTNPVCLPRHYRSPQTSSSLASRQSRSPRRPRIGVTWPSARVKVKVKVTIEVKRIWRHCSVTSRARRQHRRLSTTLICQLRWDRLRDYLSCRSSMNTASLMTSSPGSPPLHYTLFQLI